MNKRENVTNASTSGGPAAKIPKKNSNITKNNATNKENLQSQVGISDVEPAAELKKNEEEDDEDDDDEEIEPLKPKVKVILATALKKELLKQHGALSRNRVLKLPREPKTHTVQSLFSDYEVEAIAKARGAKQIDRAKEIVSGLKTYFDASLQKALLYEKEKKYFEETIQKNESLKSKPASEICGAEHLLRLYVKLPEFIPVEAFMGENGEKNAETIGDQLGETLRWLQKRSHEAFDGSYVEIDDKTGKVVREVVSNRRVDDDDDDEEEDEKND